MDAKKLDAIIRKEVDEAVGAAAARIYAEGFMDGFFTCLTQKNLLQDEHKFKSEKVEGMRQ